MAMAMLLGVALDQLLTQHTPEDLTRGRLGDLINEVDTATQLLVGGNVLSERLEVLLRDLHRRLAHNEGSRQLTSLFTRLANHSDISHIGVCEEKSLELSRGHLEPLVLDELLQPVNNRNTALRVDDGNVTSVQETVRLYGGLGGIGPLEVALHDLGPTDAELTGLAVRNGIGRGSRLDEAHFGVGNEVADLAGHKVGSAKVGEGAGFSHAVALLDLAVKPLRQLNLKLSGERRSARDDHMNGGEIELVDNGVLGKSKGDGRGNVQIGDLVLLDRLKIRDEVELGHKMAGVGKPKGVAHDENHTINMEEGQHSKEAIISLQRHLTVLILKKVRDEVEVGQLNTLRKTSGTRAIREGTCLVLGVRFIHRWCRQVVVDEIFKRSRVRTKVHFSKVRGFGVKQNGGQLKFLAVVKKGGTCGEHSGTAIIDLKIHLIGGVGRIEGRNLAAQPHCRKHQRSIFNRVGQVDGKDIALLKTLGSKLSRNLGSQRVELTKGEGSIGGDIVEGNFVLNFRSAGTLKNELGKVFFRDLNIGIFALVNFSGGCCQRACGNGTGDRVSTNLGRRRGKKPRDGTERESHFVTRNSTIYYRCPTRRPS
eukprot:Colp12_sorted_trinity150504_noHs@2979